MCYFLAKNPAVQKKAQMFVDKVLDGHDPTYDKVDELTYIDNIVNETMRLIPPVPQTARVAMTEFTWNGVVIPKDVSLNDFIILKKKRHLLCSLLKHTLEMKNISINLMILFLRDGII